MLCFILGQRLSAGITQIGERKFLDPFSILPFSHLPRPGRTDTIAATRGLFPKNNQYTPPKALDILDSEALIHACSALVRVAKSTFSRFSDEPSGKKPQSQCGGGVAVDLHPSGAWFIHASCRGPPFAIGTDSVS